MDRALKYHGSADLHTPIHPPQKEKEKEDTPLFLPLISPCAHLLRASLVNTVSTQWK